MVPLWFTLSALCFVGAAVLLYVDIDRRRGRGRRRKSWARSHGFDYEQESTEILKRWKRGVMSTVGSNIPARNVVLGQIRGEAVFIFDLEEVATVIALHRKVGTNVVVDVRLKGLKEPRENDIWLLGAIGPRMVYSTNLDAARRACDRRMVTFAHTAPDCAEIMWNEQNWTLVSMPIGSTRAQWDEGLRTVRQFNDLLRVLPPVPQSTATAGAPQASTRRKAAPSRPLAPAGRSEATPGHGEPIHPRKRIHDPRRNPAACASRARTPPADRPQRPSGVTSPTLSQSRTGAQYTDAVPRRVALITGPTSGIGEGFARRYAADGYDVVLVSRDADRLKALAAELSNEGGCNVEVLPADLADAAGRDTVAERLASGVDVLVNNAGFGTSGEFWTADPAMLQRQLDVNVTAVMQLTRAALPAMIDKGAGTVINVSSVAGLLSGRGSTYSASKAYVVSFTEGLAVGLRGTGVGIHVVCPGYVHTEFHDRAGIDMTSLPSFMWLEVDDVVRETLAEVSRGNVLIIPGLQYKALTTVSRMVPRTLSRAATSVFGRGRGRT